MHLIFKVLCTRQEKPSSTTLPCSSHAVSTPLSLTNFISTHQHPSYRQNLGLEGHRVPLALLCSYLKSLKTFTFHVNPKCLLFLRTSQFQKVSASVTGPVSAASKSPHSPEIKQHPMAQKRRTKKLLIEPRQPRSLHAPQTCMICS